MAALWQDDIDLKVYISNAGDFVSLGNRQEYPFTPGGSGYPSGWTMFNTAGSSPSDVNWTTQNGRFSVSNASTTDPHAAKFYGVYRDFPVTPGKFYIFQLQARRMDGKSARVSRNIRYEWSTGVGTGAFGFASDDWEQVSIPTGAAPTGVTFLRIIIQGVYYCGNVGPGIDPVADVNWGVQFQNVSVIEQDSTYPEPSWDEVTCEVRNLSLRYGRDRFVNRYDVASMSLSVINDSGQFTYTPASTLRPGRFIKVEAAEHAFPQSTYDQFYGIIDSLTDSFTLDGHAVTTIQAVDISTLLSNTTVPTASWDSNTYKSGSRFLRLLDSVAWHPSMRSAMAGIFTQQPILANGRSVRDELGLIADSEGGYFYADRSGVLTYQDRSWNILQNRAVNAELMAQPVELVETLEPTVKFGFNGVVGNYLRVPYVSTFNTVNGGIDIQVRLTVNNWAAAAHMAFMSRYEGSALSWIFGHSTTGRGILRLYVQGLGGTRLSTAAVPYADGERCWVRVTRRDSDGRIQFFHAPDMESTPTLSQWVQLGADVTSTAGAMPATTAGVVIGGRSTGQEPLNGEMWSARIRDGTTVSTTVLYVSVASAKDQVGATSFNISTPVTTVNVFQVAPWTVIQSDPTPGLPALPVVDDIPDVSSPSAMPIICLRELQTTWSRDRVVNEVSVANQGGSSITTIDAASQQKYGPRTYQRMDFLNTNDDISYLTIRTQDIMDGYTDAIIRVNSVQFVPTPDTNVYWFTLRVWLNWLVRVRYTHPTQGWGFSVVSHVQGIEHAWTQRGWLVTLFLDNPEAFNYWNSATTAGWDESLWDVDLWDATRRDEVYWSSGQKWSEGHRWG